LHLLSGLAAVAPAAVLFLDNQSLVKDHRPEQAISIRSSSRRPFAGNPLSCIAALAALETIEKEGLLGRSTEIGKRFEARARGWQKKWGLVGDVRGLGGMRAIELVRNPATREPAETETKQIARFCYEHGLITITAGTFNNVIRILVPLVVTDEQFDEGLDVIEAALASVAEPKHAALSRA
jgi:4-aminobutyrate aminotransferase / (S)-3-amino-2-methylpropionate transaminase / 5-aminovalerate transaminase